MSKVSGCLMVLQKLALTDIERLKQVVSAEE